MRGPEALEASPVAGRAGRRARAAHAGARRCPSAARRTISLNALSLGLLALGVAGAACGSRGAAAARLHARIIRPPHDTTRFETPVIAGRCQRSGAGGLLLQGTELGNGVLVFLRSDDSLASGEFPLLARADSTTRRGAIVAARFTVGDAAHGVTLDSGAVSVARTGDALTVRAVGAGSWLTGTGRLSLDATFDAVRVGPDTVPCRMRP